MKRFLVLGLAALMPCAVAGCASKPQDLIVGKWEGTAGPDRGATMEFAKDGTLKASNQGKSVDAKYRFVDDRSIKITIEIDSPRAGEALAPGSVEGPKTWKTAKQGVTVTRDELTLTNDSDQTSKYKRVK